MSDFTDDANHIFSDLMANNSIQSILDGDAEYYEFMSERAENLCMYNHECLEHIAELEGEYGDHIDDGGMEYAAENWADAMRSYAYHLVSAALNDAFNEQLEALRTSFEEFETEVERLDAHDCVNIDKASIGGCEYGWEAHNYETCEGVMIWSDERVPHAYNPRLLEGELIAVSHKLSTGDYINICWAK